MTNIIVTTTPEAAPGVAESIRMLKPVSEVRIHTTKPVIDAKPPFTVVFPVAENDISLAIRHAQWLSRLSPLESRHEAVIAYDAAVATDKLEALLLALRKCFATVNAMALPIPPIKKWPFAPNWAFQHVALQMAYRGKPWLWLEPDCVVMKPDCWLRQLQAEYDRCGKNFMGPIVKPMGHMNGCAIYPADLPKRSPTAMSCQETAFDFAMKHEVIADCHDASHLMQHIWSVNNGVMSESQDGPPPIKMTESQARSWIHRTAVIVHRVKDDSLIKLLEAGYNAPRVEVVVCNWRRPKNIPKILALLHAQTVPVKLTLIDASENGIDGRGFDRVFRVPNMGSWNRFAIAGSYDCDYTLFIDDDVLPSRDCAAHLMDQAIKLQNEFAVLGFRGRKYADGKIEVMDEEDETVRSAQWLARVYFIKTERIIHVLTERLRCRLELPMSHDDAIMGFGITRHTGLPCYVLPSPAGMKWDDLPDNDAVWKTANYIDSLAECLHKLSQ